MDDRGVAPVVDIDRARRRRNEARREIVQAANRVRLGRARYLRWAVRSREVAAPKMLTMRQLQAAVAIVRHWGVVDDATLRAAGFGPRRRPVAPVAGATVGSDLMEEGEAA